MRKNTIRLIIVVMSFAMVGLVGLQYYWISNALKINSEQFRRDVYESLNTVVNKLERQEVLFYTYNHLNILDIDEQEYFSLKDSILAGANMPMSLFRGKTLIQPDSTEKQSKLIQLLTGAPFPADTLQGQHYQNQETGGTGIAANAIESMVEKGGDDGRRRDIGRDQKTQLELRSLDKAAKKTEMVTLVLEELLYGKRHIRNRLDSILLDSLLKAEFLNKGIDASYSYHVVDKQDQQLFASDSAGEASVLRQQGLKVRLFPNDMLSEASFLAVYFPDQQQYLIKKSWVPLFSSLLLILIIVFCFGYAIHIIIRQKKLSEIKNDFINNMTHEFKTPISIVSLACEALQDPAFKEDQQFLQRYLGIIRDENARLATQVEKVLQMATLDKQDFIINKELVSMHDIIEKAVDHLHLQAEKRNTTVALDLAAENPQVIGDEVHLINIIFNILDNANKYSPNSPHITIKTFNKTDGMVISISDRGIGMSKEALPRIFEKFYRVHTGNLHDVKGFGLGLAYVKTMVEAHGGRITVSSELHKGSTFEIFLPHTYE